MKLRTIIVLQTLVLAAACSDARPWQGTIEERDGAVYVGNPEQTLWDRGAERLRFDLEQTFGVERDPAEAVLGIIDAFQVDSSGNVYVVESSPGRLKSFRPDGTLRWSRGRPGEGPADLIKPYGLAWDGGDLLYMTNQSGRRLDVWRTDGSFVESRALPVKFRPFMRVVGFIDDSHLVLVGSGLAGAEVILVVLDLADAAAAPVEFAANVDNVPRDDGATFPTVAVVGDLIAIGDYDSYDLRFYNGRGELVRVVSRPGRALPGPAFSPDGRASTVLSWLDPPVRLAGGQLLTTAAWVETDDPDATFAKIFDGRGPLTWNSSLDLFDGEGRLLYSLESMGEGQPEIGRPVAVDSAGMLYTLRDDPFPQIRRYRVDIDGS